LAKNFKIYFENERNFTMKRNAQKEEAIKRMKKLGLANSSEFPVITMFEKEGKLCKSMPVGNIGVLYTLTKAEKSLVEDFENETKCLVYHLIRNKTELGVWYTFLYVSKYPEEWDMDNKDLDFGTSGKCFPFARVYNVGNVSENTEKFSDDTYAEYGTVGIKKGFGGLIRTD
jgi:hypothetical protein